MAKFSKKAKKAIKIFQKASFLTEKQAIKAYLNLKNGVTKDIFKPELLFKLPEFIALPKIETPFLTNQDMRQDISVNRFWDNQFNPAPTFPTAFPLMGSLS